MGSSNGGWGRPIAHFLGHAFVGAILFVIVGSLATALAMFVKEIETLGVPEFTIMLLSFLEHIIFAGDVILYLVYMYIASAKFIREISQ